jgi:uncharacterized protein
MMRRTTEVGKGVTFVVLVLSLALGAALVIRVFDIKSEFTGALLYMSTPTVATVLMLLVMTRDGWSGAGWRSLGLRRSRRSTWPWAAGVTFLASLVASIVVWTTPVATFTTPDGALDELINFVINVVVMMLTIVLAEEIGWRGYLLPRMLALGQNRSFVLVGLVHGLWHLPLLLLTSLYHSDGHVALTVPLLIATLVAASFAFGYLRVASGSVWPSTVAHAVHNAAWALLGTFTITDHDVVVEEYLAGDNGILILGTTILAAWLIRRRVAGLGRPHVARTAVGSAAT